MKHQCNAICQQSIHIIKIYVNFFTWLFFKAQIDMYDIWTIAKSISWITHFVPRIMISIRSCQMMKLFISFHIFDNCYCNCWNSTMKTRSINYAFFYVITIVSQISACIPSSFQVVEIENPNMDCLCPEQFKEENEASNDPKFTILKTEKSYLTGIILHKW